jgi:regulator of replication initiation timing
MANIRESTVAIQSVDVDTIGRLAEKVNALVGLLDRTRAELAQTTEANDHLSKEVDRLRAQVASADGEREQVRTRVSEMLTQLDALDL